MVIQSGSTRAHREVASGKYPIGITTEKAASQYLNDEGDHLFIVYPTEGTSAVPDCISIVKGCANIELAKLFEEFLLSRECQTLLWEQWKLRPIRKDIEIKGLPTLSRIPLVSFDYEYASKHRSDIISKWQDVLTE